MSYYLEEEMNSFYHYPLYENLSNEEKKLSFQEQVLQIIKVHLINLDNLESGIELLKSINKCKTLHQICVKRQMCSKELIEELIKVCSTS